MYRVGGRRVEMPRAWGVYALGSVLLLAGVAATDVHFRDEGAARVLFYAFMDVLVPVSVVLVGVYAARSDLESADLRTATAWFVAGAVVCGVLYLWSRIHDVLAGNLGASLGADLALFANLGGALGLVAGLNRARARQNRRLAEQAATQRQTLEFVNHLLRHNILNGLQVIEGYAGFLEDHVDDEGDRLLATVRNRTHHMNDLVNNVRVLMDALTEAERRPVDCTTLLAQEVSVARAAHPQATFETDLPESLWVLANPALGPAFENLLANAVRHHDGPTPTVRVSGDRRGDRVVVRVADDGPGIPDGLKVRYLQKGERSVDSAGDGLGLFLVSTLVEAFDGSVRVEDNAPRGTVFEVSLPAVENHPGPPADVAPPVGEVEASLLAE